MSNIFHIRKPLKVEPNFELLRGWFSGTENFIQERKLIEDASGANYLSYSKFIYKVEALPTQNFAADNLWQLVKLERNSGRVNGIVKDEGGKFYSFKMLDYMPELLHKIDMSYGDSFLTKKQPHQNRKQILINSLMEEAIASSQMEGAATTREVAKRMLREGRKPRNYCEQMIANNYAVIEKIRSEYSSKDLSLDVLFEIHETLIANTRKDWVKVAGKLRKDDDKIVVEKDGKIYHIPPKELFLRKELSRLIDFANNKLSHKKFIHPLIRGIILHFWVGYLHPFQDGNGRLARALFYWYAIKHGYSIFSLLPISKAIIQSPAKYVMAYTLSEQDDLDLTYFIDYNLQKINQALDDFHKYLQDIEETKFVWKIFSDKYVLNDRQLSIVKYLFKKQSNTLTAKSATSMTGVTYITALHDLHKLEKDGIVTAKKIGARKPYVLTEKALGELRVVQ
ncbi:MAG: Fic family protein [Patescibacteria group bacterium]